MNLKLNYPTITSVIPTEVEESPLLRLKDNNYDSQAAMFKNMAAFRVFERFKGECLLNVTLNILKKTEYTNGGVRNERQV